MQGRSTVAAAAPAASSTKSLVPHPPPRPAAAAAVAAPPAAAPQAAVAAAPAPPAAPPEGERAPRRQTAAAATTKARPTQQTRITPTAAPPSPTAYGANHGVAAALFHSRPVVVSQRAVYGPERKREVLGRIVALGTRLSRLQSDLEVDIEDLAAANRLEVEKRRHEEAEAALRLQMAWRVHAATTRVAGLRQNRLKMWEEQRAIERVSWAMGCRIQRAWRAWCARNILRRFKAEMERRRERNFTYVQASCRALLSTWYAMRKRNWREDTAARIVQRCYRGYADREAYRRHRAEREAEAMRARHLAATKIACAWRCHLARKELSRRRSSMHTSLAARKRHYAATRIQTQYRRHAQQQKFHTRRSLERARTAERDAARDSAARAEARRLNAAGCIQRAWRSALARAAVQARRDARASVKAIVMAAATREIAAEDIQSFARIVRAKARIRQRKQEIQSHLDAIAAEEAARRREVEEKEYTKYKHAKATDIQRVWRGHASREGLNTKRAGQIDAWEKAVVQHNTAAALVIQRNWRGLLGRRVAAELFVEAEETLSEIRTFDRQHDQVLSVQNWIRYYLAAVDARDAEIEWTQWRNENAIRIQAAWRGAQTRDELRRKREGAAAVVIQQYARAAVASIAAYDRLDALVNESRRRAEAAVLLQSAFRGALSTLDAAARRQRMLARTLYDRRRHAASCCIQRMARSHFARAVAGERQTASANKLKGVRAHDTQIECVLRLQAAFRARLTHRVWGERLEVARLRSVERVKDVISTQAHLRAIPALQAVRARRLVQGLTLVQAACRAMSSVGVLRKHLSAEEALQQYLFRRARTIQCAWRQHAARKEVALRRQQRVTNTTEMVFCERQNAALVIQRFARVHSARVEVEIQKRRWSSHKRDVKSDEAAVVIQEAWRAHRSRRVLSAKRRARAEADLASEAIEIAAVMGVAQSSAIVVQQHARAHQSQKKIHLLREQRREEDEKSNLAATSVQRVYRGHRGRGVAADARASSTQLSEAEIHEAEAQAMAAVAIQCAWRRHQARIRCAEVEKARLQAIEDLRRDEAAASIQHGWRYFKARRAERLRNRERVALRKQAEEERTRNREAAARRIQRAWRRSVARQRGRERRAVTDAAMEKQNVLEAQHAAAVLVQTQWRMFLARRMVTEIVRLRADGMATVRRHDAAISVQRLWRCHAARMELQRRKDGILQAENARVAAEGVE